jgi:hypothetical protein
LRWWLLVAAAAALAARSQNEHHEQKDKQERNEPIEMHTELLRNEASGGLIDGSQTNASALPNPLGEMRTRKDIHLVFGLVVVLAMAILLFHHLPG